MTAPPPRPPTARQLEIVAYMREYHDEYGIWPTIREIAAALGKSSTNGIHEQLVSLQSKGLVVQRKRCARGWIVVAPETP